MCKVTPKQQTDSLFAALPKMHSNCPVDDFSQALYPLNGSLLLALVHSVVPKW